LESKVPPLEIPLAKGGEAFWLDSRTVAHVVESEEDKKLHLYSLTLKFETESCETVLANLEPPTLIGIFPTSSATNFRYSSASGNLVFSDYVYADGNISSVKMQDDAWNNRGTSALVYDSTYTRHWDHWVGPKSSSLFSVQLSKNPDNKWTLGSEFINLLKDTGHVSSYFTSLKMVVPTYSQSSPVEPFGGIDDFDVSGSRVVYTSKDPTLPQAWHTKQNVCRMYCLISYT
jgi:hypothetical protein